MAVFKGDNHLARAARASLAIRQQFTGMPASDIARNFVPRISIGINTGDMVSGNIGSVTLRRLDYTVIGDSVNTAQRLQSAAGENQILITEEAYSLIKEQFHCNCIGTVKLKNKIKEVVLYEILGENTK